MPSNVGLINASSMTMAITSTPHARHRHGSSLLPHLSPLLGDPSALAPGQVVVRVAEWQGRGRQEPCATVTMAMTTVAAAGCRGRGRVPLEGVSSKRVRPLLPHARHPPLPQVRLFATTPQEVQDESERGDKYPHRGKNSCCCACPAQNTRIFLRPFVRPRRGIGNDVCLGRNASIRLGPGAVDGNIQRGCRETRSVQRIRRNDGNRCRERRLRGNGERRARRCLGLRPDRRDRSYGGRYPRRGR